MTRMPMRRRCLVAGLVLVLLAGAAGPARADETLSFREELTYRWRLDGFVGALAGLFFPNQGEGLLTQQMKLDGTLRSELLITAAARAEGDFFRYGADWRPDTGTTLRAWSSSQWRGERKDKQAEVGRTGVIDVASAVALLRRHPPRESRRLEIWSEGKLYPVEVQRHGLEERACEGRPVRARHYSVRGLERPGQRHWKGELHLWLARDPGRTPVEIWVSRSSARVRMELVGGACTGLPVAAGEPAR
jgi:hypothetical protein